LTKLILTEGSQSNRGQTCHSANSSATNLTLTTLRANSDLCGNCPRKLWQDNFMEFVTVLKDLSQSLLCFPVIL